MIKALIQRVHLLRIVQFVGSFIIVAWGQPALVGWLGSVSAACGFALLLRSIDSFPQKQRILAAACWFACVQAVQLAWMTSIEFQGYYLLGVYLVLSLLLGAQFAFFVWTIPFARILISAALWACLEWSRLLLFCGFSWNPVGLSLCHFATSLQWASIWGVLGLSFWVMLTNLTVLSCMQRGWKFSCSFFACLCIALPYLFGWGHLNYHKASSCGSALNVAVLQTNLLPCEKQPSFLHRDRFVPPFEQWHRIIDAFSLAAQAESIDLAVLPEAVVPLQANVPAYPLSQVEAYCVGRWGAEILSHFPPLHPPYAGSCLRGDQKEICVSNLFWAQLLCNYLKADLVIGLDYTDVELRQNFNSAFYLQPRQTYVQRYDKQVLLPLGEYLPFAALKKWTKAYGIAEFFTPGKRPALWGNEVLFSPCICYEETFSGVIRKAKLLGAQLLVNLTNDNYYPNSSLHRQHFFHARPRCVENGMALIRSCNAGVSGVIDSLGQVIGQIDGSAGESVVMHCKLSTYTYTPLFSWYGEGGVIGVCLLVVILGWLRKEKIYLDKLLRQFLLELKV